MSFWHLQGLGRARRGPFVYVRARRGLFVYVRARCACFFYFGGLTENLAKQDDKHFFDKLHRTVLATLLCQPRQGASELYTSRLRALLEQAALFPDTEADTAMLEHQPCRRMFPRILNSVSLMWVHCFSCFTIAEGVGPERQSTRECEKRAVKNRA